MVWMGRLLQASQNNSPIQTIIVPGNERVKTLSKKLAEAGFDVRPILSPTVPKGSERLRICLHAFNTEAQLTKLLTTINTAL